MHWQPRRNGGWQVVAEPAECDGTNEEVLLVFQTNERCLICLIAQTEQPPLLNIQMVQKEEEDKDEDESVSGSSEIDGEEWSLLIVVQCDLAIVVAF